MRVEEESDVVGVLTVELPDLQLGQQQVGQRDRRAVDGEPLDERDTVAHLEHVEQHVDLRGVLALLEYQPVPAVERIDLLVRGVAELSEDTVDDLDVGVPGDEVDVTVGPPRADAMTGP